VKPESFISESKLSAIAGMLAALMYDAVPYYARAEKYNIDHCVLCVLCGENFCSGGCLVSVPVATN
jgi:hypothetical protein